MNKHYKCVFEDFNNFLNNPESDNKDIEKIDDLLTHLSNDLYKNIKMNFPYGDTLTYFTENINKSIFYNTATSLELTKNTQMQKAYYLGFVFCIYNFISNNEEDREIEKKYLKLKKNEIFIPLLKILYNVNTIFKDDLFKELENSLDKKVSEDNFNTLINKLYELEIINIKNSSERKILYTTSVANKYHMIYSLESNKQKIDSDETLISDLLELILEQTKMSTSNNPDALIMALNKKYSDFIFTTPKSIYSQICEISDNINKLKNQRQVKFMQTLNILPNSNCKVSENKNTSKRLDEVINNMIFEVK